MKPCLQANMFNYSENYLSKLSLSALCLSFTVNIVLNVLRNFKERVYDEINYCMSLPTHVDCLIRMHRLTIVSWCNHGRCVEKAK